VIILEDTIVLWFNRTFHLVEHTDVVTQSFAYCRLVMLLTWLEQ